MSHAATSLNGPYNAPTGVNGKSIHSAPSCHMKGSVNKGGGGGGKGSGCGKPSPCGGAKKKTKSCGGKSKSCGGKKKKSCSPVQFKVAFKDVNGNLIGSIQQVGKDSAATPPWESATDIPDAYKIDGYIFDKWSTYDYKNVQKDMEVNAVYRQIITGNEVCGGKNTQVIDGKMSDEDGQKIQNFSDEYLNQKAGTAKARDLDEDDEYYPQVPNYGKYNQAINVLSATVDQVSHKIDFVMDQLFEYREECTDWATFEDIKKCLLNIQTTFVYQTRMALNLDLQDIYIKIVFDVDDLIEKARKNESIDKSIEDYRSELDLDLDFFKEDNKDRYNEFVDSYNAYIETLNTCFPSDILQFEKIKKED